MGCHNSSDGTSAFASGGSSQKDVEGGRKKKKGTTSSGKYAQEDSPTVEVDEVSGKVSLGRQGGGLLPMQRPSADHSTGSVTGDEKASYSHKRTSHTSHTSSRVILTKGALGRNGREEEEWRREQQSMAHSTADSHRSLGSPKGSFQSSRVSSRQGRPVPTTAGVGGGLGGGLRGYGHAAARSDSKFDMDDNKSVASMSDRESVMTTESFFDLAGKKMNRPRSAKGHPAVEPSAAEMANRITRHAMKGLLSDIDETVEPATMIRTSNWTKLLTDKRRAAKSSGLLNPESEMPGIVDIVDVNNQTGDKSLDDVLSLMSYFPCSGEDPQEEHQPARRATMNQSHRSSRHNATAGPAGAMGTAAPTAPALPTAPPPKKFLDMGIIPVKEDEEGSEGSEEEEKEQQDDDMRRTSFLVKPGARRNGGVVGGGGDFGIGRDEMPTAVGRYYFSEHKKLHRYYERHVKPWILDYLFEREEIDASLLPSGFATLTVITPGAADSAAGSPGGTVGPDTAFTCRMAFSVTDFGDSSHHPGHLASRTTNDSGPSLEEPGLSVANSTSNNERASSSVLAQPDYPTMFARGEGGNIKSAQQTPNAAAANQMGEDEVMAMMM